MGKRKILGICALFVFGAVGCVLESDTPEEPGENGGSENSGGTGGTGTQLTGSGTTQPGEACTETEECVPGSLCFNEFCVGAGTLRVSLAFDVDADFDLHLETPLGSHIYYGNDSADGGTLDVDQCVGSCGVGAHVENIVFENTVPGGEYEVWVVNFNGRSAGSFEIEVAGAVNRTFSGSLPATSGSSSERFTFSAPGSSNGSGGSSGSGGTSNGGSGSGGTGGTNSGGAGGSASGGSGGSDVGVDCEMACPSEFPNDTQLDVFCRMACCYDVNGDSNAASQTCLAGSELGTGSCNYCQ